jgi:hypothetical protein
MGLPREKQQDEEDSGSRDRELCRQDGGAARKRLRHRQLPPTGQPTVHAWGRKGQGTAAHDR